MINHQKNLLRCIVVYGIQIKSLLLNSLLIDMLYNIFGEEKVKTHNIIGIKFELVGDCK